MRKGLTDRIRSLASVLGKSTLHRSALRHEVNYVAESTTGSDAWG